MVSTQEFVQFVRRYNLEESLSFIARIGRAIFDDTPQFARSPIGKYVPQAINLWQLAFLAKTLILHSNDYRAKSLDERELFKCANLYNDLDDPFVTKNGSERTVEDAYNFLLRTAYQQFPYQQSIRNDFGRSLYLYLDINQSVGLEKFDINEQFRKLRGLSILEFMVIGIALFASMTSGELPVPVRTELPKLEPYLQQGKVDKFLAATMVDYKTFRDVQHREPTREGYETFEFNCLWKYPLIKTERSKRIIAPIPLLIAHRVTRGLYYDLLDEFNMGGKRNPFASFFGKEIFEEYVGMLLKKLYKHGIVLRERRYARGLDTADWMIKDRDALVLVECKSADLTKAAKTFAEHTVLQSDLRKRVIKGISTCHRTEKHIRQGASGLEDLGGPQRIHCVIVTLDYSFLANSSPYRVIVDRELKERLGFVPCYHVISIYDFEEVFNFLEDVSFSDLLACKEENQEWYGIDFSAFLQLFAREKLRREVSWGNALLDAKYKEFFAHMA